VTPLLVFFFAGLPIGIAVLGVILGETFRARQIRAVSAHKTAADTDVHNMRRIVVDQFVTLRELIELRRQRAARYMPEIVMMYGDIPVGRFRTTYGYGSNFAWRHDDNHKLSDVIDTLDDESRQLLVEDHQSGRLTKITGAA
jgi:hypothetical protein